MHGRPLCVESAKTPFGKRLIAWKIKREASSELLATKLSSVSSTTIPKSRVDKWCNTEQMPRVALYIALDKWLDSQKIPRNPKVQ